MAERYLERARAIAAHAHDSSARAYVHTSEMLNLLWDGRWTEVRAQAALAARLAEQIGDHHVLERTWLICTIIAFQTGDIEEGLDYADRLVRSADERGDSLHAGFGVLCSSLFLTLLGRFEEAAARIERARTSETCARYDFLRIEHLAAQAFFLVRSGRAPEAVPLADRVLSQITIDMPRIGVFFGYAAAVEVHLRRWEDALRDRPLEAASASKAARRAVLGLFSCALQIKSLWAAYYLARAWQLRLAGATRRSARTCRRAISMARAAQARYVEARRCESSRSSRPSAPRRGATPWTRPRRSS